LQTLNILVTVWEMKTLSEAIMGSGENTLLTGSSPVAGTNLRWLRQFGRQASLQNCSIVNR
jgi:hypothetical protein